MPFGWDFRAAERLQTDSEFAEVFYLGSGKTWPRLFDGFAATSKPSRQFPETIGRKPHLTICTRFEDDC
jgi:hypothetical protein